jgi:hypothetical protein
VSSARGALGPIATIAALTALTGCAAPAAATLPTPTALEWTRVRERLRGARALEPQRPYVEEIVVAMREPLTRKTFQARGALAIDPHRALRMILIGPGGATAPDVWVTDDRWRFVVPALSIRKSGGTDPASWRGLPIGFFRWWMLHPLDGRLLAAWLKKGDPIYLLRRGDDTVLLRDHREADGHHVVAMRRERGAIEEVEWVGRAPTPHAGDKARYVHGPSGLEVEVLVEAVSEEEPDAAAFLDPDAAGTSL